MKLSIIIPVYQGEKYLKRCIDSVLSQSFTDFELILVDDGSTDNSIGICNGTAQRNQKVKVIHKKNGGLSSARNAGIEVATGDFITFLDSDDEITSHTFMLNMRQLEDDPSIDLLEYPVDVHHGAKNAYVLRFTQRTVRKDILSDWIKSKGYTHCYAWNKFYRRSLFDGIRYPEGETFEDAAVCPDIISRCSAVKYSDKGMYIYHSSSDTQSITRSYTFRCQEPLFRHNLNLYHRASEMGLNRESVEIWLTTLNLLIDLSNCKGADNRYITAAAAHLSVYRPPLFGLLKQTSRPAEIMKALCASILGVRTVIYILNNRKN